MQPIVNTEQFEAWNGHEGRHWAESSDRYEAMNAELNEPLFSGAAIGPGDRVLDIGCGNGRTTRIAAREAVRGSAFGIDLSAPMLATARAAAAAEGLGNVVFEQADAQVYPFEPATFDVAISRAAVMFFADPVAAFANIARALRPGGRFAFVALGDLTGTEFGRVFAAALRGFLPEHYAEADRPGPASLADPVRTADVLTAAGFHEVRADPVTVRMKLGEDAGDAARFLAVFGPVHHFLREATEEQRAAARRAFETELSRHEKPSGVRLTMTALRVTARKP